MRNLLFGFVVVLLCTQCKKQSLPDPDPIVSTSNYFPPTGSLSWESITPASVGWNEAELSNLYPYLEQKGTKAFIILKHGKMVTEKYFGTFTIDSSWYWASAGKTLTSFLVGIAQQEGLLNINDKSSQYLGKGWTSLPAAKEDLITIKHQLTMTTGLNDEVQPDNDCTLPACLQYKADAGTRWAYHNAPYTILEKVVEAASGTSYNQFFQQKVRDKIGMNGLWVKNGYNNVFFSTPRSMARFGLLLLKKGKWKETVILNETYYNAQVNTSQSLNNAYGYLTWLNGKNTYRMPSTQLVFSGPLIPNAPADMYAALGKNDQKIYVVPSQGIVVIRMGESAGNVQLASSSFDNELWGKLKTIFKY